VYCRKVKIALEGKDHEVRDTVRPQECQSVGMEGNTIQPGFEDICSRDENEVSI